MLQSSGVGLGRHLLHAASTDTALHTGVCTELWWGVGVQLDQEGKGFQGCCLSQGLSMAPWVMSAEVTHDLPYACGLGFAARACQGMIQVCCHSIFPKHLCFVLRFALVLLGSPGNLPE